MHRLHGLPLAVVEQGLEVLTDRGALRPSREAAGEPVGKLAEPLQPRASPRLGHTRQRTKLLSSGQVPHVRDDHVNLTE